MPFARILRSSALMGGAQAVTLAMAFLRSKLIAVMIGPTGIGLMGVFNAFNSNVSTVAGWGIATSSVRVIAGADESARAGKIASVRTFGRRLAWCGLLGVLLLVFPIGYLTFESQKYSLELLLAGLAVPCVIATTMWSSLLQAAGHIGTLARTQMSASVAGLLAGVPFIYFFGTIGIALSILLAAMVAAAVTWRAAARFCPPGEAQPSEGTLRELLHLGLIFQIGGVLGAISTYLVRVLILRSHGADLAAGLADAGYYQAAFALTGSLPGVIFSVTNSDFYPRVAAAKDEQAARIITEKQIQASLLLAMPFLVALLTMAPLAIRLLYAKGFEPAVPLLDWFTWAIFCNLLGWPLGFWVVARRSKRTVALFQSLVSLLMLFLAAVLTPSLGVKGAAIAQLGSALIYGFILLVFTRRIAGRWLGADCWLYFFASAGVLVAAKATALFFGSVYVGVGLTLSVALASIILYRRASVGETAPSP